MTENYNSTYIVIPAYNEENRIGKVIEETQRLGFNNIIVVNDASSDGTLDVLNSYDDLIVVSHLINLGPGGATQTGIECAARLGAKYIATIDADNQHDPNDLVKLVDKISSGKFDMVIGSRFIQKNSIPKIRIVYNKIGNVFNYFLSGQVMTDSQSGLKIITTSLAKQLALEANGFEFCIEIIKNAKANNARITEIPISVRYTKETMDKGQSLSSGISMLSRLFSPFN